MVHAAADDVCFLPYIYHNMMEKLHERSLWKLAVSGEQSMAKPKGSHDRSKSWIVLHSSLAEAQGQGTKHAILFFLQTYHYR